MILEIRNIQKRFGGIHALRGFGFELKQGEVLGLIGPNGSGKTTVFNIITGLYRADSGQVFFQGTDITRFSIHKIALTGISRSFQATRLFFNRTVSENLGIVCEAPRGTIKTEETICKVLDLVGLAEQENRLASELSSADQRLLMIALGLSLSPKVLLLDEPTAGMNAEEVSRTLGIIETVSSDGCAVLLIEHNMGAVTRVCSRSVVLSYGELIAEGSMEEIKRNPKVISAYLGQE